MDHQIAQALRQAEQGAPAGEAFRKLGVSAATLRGRSVSAKRTPVIEDGASVWLRACRDNTELIGQLHASTVA